MSEGRLLNSEEIEKIQVRGANACRLGLSVFDNPFFKKENMPIQNAEPIEVWNAKAEAWQLGYEIEKHLT